MPDPAAHSAYEIFKDFQPSFAATIALIAAGLAYLGATSKTRFDKRVATKEHEREKLGLYMRLKYEVTLIGTLARGIAVDTDIDAKLARGEFPTPERDGLASAKRLIDETPEISAAWQKIQIFPLELGKKLDLLRRRMFSVSLAIDPNIYPVFPDPTSKAPRKLTELCKDVFETAAVVDADLNEIIASTTEKLKSLL